MLEQLIYTRCKSTINFRDFSQYNGGGRVFAVSSGIADFDEQTRQRIYRVTC